MASTVAERIEFNHLTEDDFTDSQVVRMKREIRQLAAAAVTVPSMAVHMINTPEVLARMAVFMVTGVKWDALEPTFLDSLVSYARTSLATYGEGSTAPRTRP